MKRTTISLGAALILSLASAEAADLKRNTDKNVGRGTVYVEYAVSVINEEDKDLWGAQPSDEIIGDKKKEYELRIGLGTDYGNKRSEIFLLAWKADTNDEVGFGLGGTLTVRSIKFLPDLGFQIGGNVGYGWQPVKNRIFYTSTDANKVGYITNREVHYGKFKAQYTKDTDIWRINLDLGVSYRVSKDITVGARYTLQYLNYALAYILDGINSWNSINLNTYGHAGTAFVSIWF
jgi:hypothetical protein